MFTLRYVGLQLLAALAANVAISYLASNGSSQASQNENGKPSRCLGGQIQLKCPVCVIEKLHNMTVFVNGDL